MAAIKMVVGLGNPGEQYNDTRHNLGFKVIDLLSAELKIELNKKKFRSKFGTGSADDKKLILLKPWLFMNRSGEAVLAAVNFYKPVSLQDDLMVITDDMALPPGRIRIRAKGSSAGHKGLENIIENLGGDEFGRLRIGIGQADELTARDYVLSRPAEEDRQTLEDAIERAKDAVLCWLEKGIDAAMTEFNSKK